jgi:hypothetical protein
VWTGDVLVLQAGARDHASIVETPIYTDLEQGEADRAAVGD